MPEENKTTKNRLGTMWFRSIDGLIAAFAVPVLVMIIIYIQRGIFPFGDSSFLRTDMYHQYAPFFSEFKHKLATGGSMLYSWDVGLGVNFSALYAYYLASPLNWLIALCPKQYIIEFMTYMIVIKIGLSGLSMAYYLKKHSTHMSFGIGIFGIFYALSGYMAAYSWNIMWLDCILLFPIVCLGLERLVNKKKGFLYAITLGICITSNYYISIMICAFMVIYFLMLLILRGRTRGKDFFIAVGQFAFYSLIAGGISAAILLPEIYALQMTASGEFTFPQTFSSYFSIIDMLARHIGNVEVEIGLDHWPNIYCGVAVYIMILMYIANRKISLKEKSTYFVAVLFFLASFSINVLNYMWHGFHYPNSLPCRQSFIYIFIILYMCYRAYDEHEGNTVKDLGISFLCSCGFVLLCQHLVEDEGFHFAVYYVALLFLGIYALLMYLFKTKKLNVNAIIFILLGTVAVESAINTTVTSVTTTNRSSYIKDNMDVEKLVDGIYASDTSFYRFDKVTRKTKDDGAWMNFRTVSLFSSTANADLSKFYKLVGCESSTNAYSITGSTPLIDAMFDVKYALYTGASQNPNLTLIDSSGETYLYENAYTLPLAYVVKQDLEENWMLDLNNPVEVQNDLCDCLTTPYVFTQVDTLMEGNKLSFTADTDGSYYVYVTNKQVDKVDASIAEYKKSFDNIKRGYLLEMGYCKAGDAIVLTADKDDVELQAKAYRFDYDALGELVNKLGSEPLNITSYDDTHINGEVDSVEGGMLMTSIPYDKGWKVTIDGESRTTRKIEDAFLSVDIPAGKHTIEMTYYPEGRKIGILISLGSIMILVLIAFAVKMWPKKEIVEEETNEIEEPDETDEIEDADDTDDTEEETQS